MSRNFLVLFMIICDVIIALSVLAQVTVLAMIALTARNGARELILRAERVHKEIEPLLREAGGLYSTVSASLRSTARNLKVSAGAVQENWTILRYYSSRIEVFGPTRFSPRSGVFAHQRWWPASSPLHKIPPSKSTSDNPVALPRVPKNPN